MNLSSYVTLGRSGLRVSPLCLGTMTFGTQWGWGSDERTSSSILTDYLELGGNFLDTANIYTKGHSEKFIGDFLRSDNSPTSRQRVVLATKFMGNLFPGDPNGGGGGRKSILAACEESLRRLRTDYIDLYWAHFLDPHTPIEETLRAMDDLVRSGKVRYLGLSDHPAWVCAHAQHVLAELQAQPLVGLQIEYSLAQRSVEAELIPMAEHFGLGVTPWSPLKSGVLSGKFRRNRMPEGETRISEGNKHLSEKNLDIVETLVELAEARQNCTPAQIAISWLLKQPSVASVIIGARTREQLEENLGATGIDLTEDEMQRLANVSQVQHPFPHDFLKMTRAHIHGGIEINGETPPVWDLAPANDEERF